MPAVLLSADDIAISVVFVSAGVVVVVGAWLRERARTQRVTRAERWMTSGEVAASRAAEQQRKTKRGVGGPSNGGCGGGGGGDGSGCSGGSSCGGGGCGGGCGGGGG